MTEGDDPLESFLQAQKAHGEELAERGVFTIRRDLLQTRGFGQVDLTRGVALSELSQFRALQTMADSLLPFPHSWLTKTVQALVASGACTSIRMELKPGQTVISACSVPWSLEAVVEAFLDPTLSDLTQGEERSLTHFKQALWSVALHHRWPFTFYLAERAEALHWDGSTMLLGPTDTPAPETRLQVQLGPSSDPEEPAVSKARVDAQLAELARRSFTAPVPLWVDVRRLNGVHRCPSHGTGPKRELLAHGSLYADLPEIGRPGSTPFQPQEGGPEHGEPHLDEPQGVEPPAEHTRLLYALTAYALPPKSDPERPPSIGENSKVYWVHDGVVVDEERLLTPRRNVSVALFLSSEGLTSDLSGFRLRRSQEREDRVKEACETILPVLQTIRAGLHKNGWGPLGRPDVEFDSVTNTGSEGKTKTQGLALGVLGVGLAFVWPLWAGLALGAGLYRYFSEPSGERGAHGRGVEPRLLPRIEEFDRLLDDLHARLDDLPPGSPAQRKAWEYGEWER